MDELDRLSVKHRGVGIFGFGTLVPMSLITPSSPCEPQTTEDSYFTNYKDHNYTTSAFDSGVITLNSSPKGGIAELRPDFTLESLDKSTPRGPIVDHSPIARSVNGSGYSSPTRVNSSDDMMNLNKSLLGAGNQAASDCFPKTLSEFNFTSQLMESIVTKAEIGRVIMGINDDMQLDFK